MGAGEIRRDGGRGIRARASDSDLQPLGGGSRARCERTSPSPPTEAMPRTRWASRGRRDRTPSSQAGRSRNLAPHRRPGYCGRDRLAQGTGIAPGDVTRRADAMRWRISPTRYSFGEIRTTHEQNLVLADVAEERRLRGLAATRRARTRHPQHRPAHRPDLLPGPGFLLARQCRLDRRGAGDLRSLRGPRLPARHRRNQDQDVRLHERLRPSQRRPHRHPRRR